MRKLVPLALCVSVMLTAILLVYVLQLFTGKDFSFVRHFYLGYDYDAYYLATKAWWSGGSLYQDPRYVAPPFFAVLNLPMLMLAEPTAAYVICSLSFALVWGAYLLAVDCYLKPTGAAIFLGLLLAASSAPLYFLMDRGNIDAFVCAAFWLALWLGLRRDRPLAGGLFLGAAIALKIYPLPLLLPLYLMKRTRMLLGAAIALAAAVLLQLGQWRLYLGERLWTRALSEGTHKETEGVSFANFFFFLSRALRLDISDRVLSLLGFLLFAVLFAALFARDLKSKTPPPPENILFYLPLVVGIPRVVFGYQLVWLLPLVPGLCLLWTKLGPSRAARWSLGLACLGLALSQFPMEGYNQLISSGHLRAAIYGIASAGLALLAISLVRLRYQLAFLLIVTLLPLPSPAQSVYKVRPVLDGSIIAGTLLGGQSQPTSRPSRPARPRRGRSAGR